MIQLWAHVMCPISLFYAAEQSFGCCDKEMSPFAGQIKEFGYWQNVGLNVWNTQTTAGICRCNVNTDVL